MSSLQMPLQRDFFSRPTPLVARDLLGMVLVRQLSSGEQLRGRIVETEAYHSFDDSASHASKGKTARTALMFGEAGYAYIYLIYGMYNMLNVTTNEAGMPGAVLIRAVEPLAGIEHMLIRRKQKRANLTNGPGKLCQAMGIDRALNGEDMTTSSVLWFERGMVVPDEQVGRGPRINIGYASLADRERAWRFFHQENRWLSR